MPFPFSLLKAHGGVLEPYSGHFFMISLTTSIVDVVAMHLPSWTQPLIARYIMFYLAAYPGLSIESHSEASVTPSLAALSC